MIYFIQDATAHLIKIGFTDGDAAGRLRALQTGNPSGLVLLHAMDGDKSHETALHQRFAHARERGEWFRPVPELLAYLLDRLAQKSAPANCAANDRGTPWTRDCSTHRLQGKWPLTMYFAGKIRKHCWRSSIVHVSNDWSGECGYGPPDDFRSQPWPIQERAIFGEHHYCGPYFISCDHGCFHGDDTHGCNANGEWTDGNHRDGGRVIVDQCLAAIEKADLVFAWIDEADCYGTVAELGFAASIATPIWIGGPRRFRDLWFAYHLADRSYLQPSMSSYGASETLKMMLDRYRGAFVDVEAQP